MQKHRILQWARKKAGMSQRPKLDVIQHVVAQMGVAMPPTWAERYQLMKLWAVPVELQNAKRSKPPVMPAAPVVLASARGESRRAKHAAERAKGDAFLASYEWRRLRMEVIKERGARCECCGATPKDHGVCINVDHVKPRKLFPWLALDKGNLQVLCGACNHGKGNWDQTDWRESDDADPRGVTH